MAAPMVRRRSRRMGLRRSALRWFREPIGCRRRPRIPAGNVSDTGTLTVTRESQTPPAAPAVSLAPADDTGVTGDNKANHASVTISVAAESGSSVHLNDGSANGQTAIATNGVATFSVALVSGANGLSATATDSAGNVSDTGTLTVTRDSTPPAAPAVSLAPADDTGVTGDNKTNHASVTISVAAESGSSVHLNDGSANGQTAIATNGVATFSVALASGPNGLSATATDTAGNVSDTGTLTVLLDTQAPLAPSALLTARSSAAM